MGLFSFVKNIKFGNANSTQIKNTFSILFHSFSQWCTISGVNHIFGNAKLAIKIFWAVITIICIFFAIFQTFQLLDAYFKYPVDTELIPKYEEITFPAVTICGRSPYKNYKNNTYLNKIIDAFKTKKNPSWGLYDFNDNENLSYLQISQFWLKIYANELLSDTSINHDWKKNIVTCFYNNYKCDYNNLKIIKLPSYGTCFTLNHLGNWKVAKSGNEHGLKLTFTINQNDALPFYISYGGIAFIHSYEEYPFVELNPIFLSTNNDISIGLSLSSTESLPKPHGTCIPNKSYKLNSTDNFYGGMYQNEKCIRSCIQKKIIENCKCYFADYAVSEEYSSIKSCSEYIEENKNERSSTLDCIRNHIYPKFTDTEIIYGVDIIKECICYDVCEKIFYENSFSIGTYPAPTHIPSQCRETLLENQKENNIDLPYNYNQDDCISYYFQNTISLEIFFEKLSHISKIEYAQYPLIQLIYDIIGVFGFWLGMSIISFFEIFILTGATLFTCYKVSTQLLKRPGKHNNPKDYSNNLKNIPKRKDLYDKACEMQKMPPIQDS